MNPAVIIAYSLQRICKALVKCLLTNLIKTLVTTHTIYKGCKGFTYICGTSNFIVRASAGAASTL